jgi:hypothetical protein
MWIALAASVLAAFVALHWWVSERDAKLPPGLRKALHDEAERDGNVW